MLIVPPPEILPIAAGAIVTTLRAGGPLVPQQEATLRAVAAAFGAADLDLDALPDIDAARAAAAIDSPAMRRQLVQALVVLGMLEHPPSAERDRAVRHTAGTLGVDEAALRVLHDDAAGHTHRMLLDTYRAMPMVAWERAFAEQEGWGTVGRSLLATLGHGEAPELAARFHALEACPDGSLGRKVWEMYHANGWPFPGEPLGVPEATTVHDWVHILAGYAPTPIGEVQVTAFIAASSPEPSLFGALVLSLGLYEAGAFRLPQFPQAPAGGVMEQPHAPAALADALRRGAAMGTDLMQGIDHWALAGEQVDDLRARFAIPPKDEPAPTADPGR